VEELLGEDTEDLSNFAGVLTKAFEKDAMERGAKSTSSSKCESSTQEEGALEIGGNMKSKVEYARSRGVFIHKARH